MLFVRTYLDKSKVHGTGVFAKENILKGDLVYRYQRGFERSWTLEQFHALPPIAQDFITSHGYWENELFHLDGDDMAYMNHSDNANLTVTLMSNGTEIEEIIASKDIKTGEEIFCDYFQLIKYGSCLFAAGRTDTFWDGSDASFLKIESKKIIERNSYENR